mmetsp:Transcript_34494/g.63406  ORF Transcript_34494/g.63406 Transcript_34494/m.63406 type:complete len:239 (-) Transcript_34494:442-1158(-)
MMRHFQHSSSLNQETVHRSNTRPDHDRRGRRQPQSTRTRHHHHANRAHQRRHVPFLRAAQFLIHQQHPTNERDRGEHHDARCEDGGDPIGLRLYRSLVPLSFVDESDDAGKHSLRAGGGDAEEDYGELVDGGAVEGGSGAFGDREGLAGEGRFVNVGASRTVVRKAFFLVAPTTDNLAAPLSCHKYAIGGNASARQHEQIISNPNIGNVLLLRAERVQVQFGKHLRNNLPLLLSLQQL